MEIPPLVSSVVSKLRCQFYRVLLKVICQVAAEALLPWDQSERGAPSAALPHQRSKHPVCNTNSESKTGKGQQWEH